MKHKSNVGRTTVSSRDYHYTHMEHSPENSLMVEKAAEDILKDTEGLQGRRVDFHSDRLGIDDEEATVWAFLVCEDAES